MDAEELSKLIKSGRASVPVFEVVVSTGQTELKGSGTLDFTPGKFALRFSCVEGVPPTMPTIIHRENFWSLAGRFVSGCAFSSANVPPPCWLYWPPKECTLNLAFLDLESAGGDTAQYNSLLEHLKMVAEANSTDRNQGELLKTGNYNSRIFHVVIADCPLVFATEEVTQTTEHPFFGKTIRGAGNVLRGAVEKFEFCLATKEGDLVVDVRSKNGEVTDESEERGFLDALLRTISLTHGQKIRSFLSQCWRDNKFVENRLRPINPPVRNSNVPFPESLCLEGRIGRVSFNFQSAFEQVVKFFYAARQSKLRVISGYLSELQSTSVENIHPLHARLAVCRVFEGVVDLLFDDLNLEAIESENSEVVEFKAAKKKICEWIRENEGMAFTRIGSIVASANPLTTREKYQALTRHFRLDMHDISRTILDDWRNARHRLAHGESDVGEGSGGHFKAWTAQTRIEGGINMLLLKRCGYSGLMSISPMEKLLRLA